ncbi:MULTISPECIES: ABC transporter substrate-binding protein [Flavobacterium]|nr:MULTISPECIES: ABC transporter substrate-binding protein [Flavobacterium]MDQ7959803.1 ABC transporter substrate-binding protein [Flavobacterium lindanitolerans]
MKIGILLPQSKQYPSLDRDFMRGMKLNDLDVKFFIESIGIGADEKIIIEKMQKLSLQEDISIFIGFLGHRNIQSVYDYASNHNLFLLATDMGSTLPYALPKKQGVYINSFGIAESSYHLGAYFASQNYKNIATSSSYYDSGYGINQAIEMALYQNDSQFSGHYITPLNPRENEADCMQETLAPLKPDAIFAFHSGIYAEEHASYLTKNKLTQDYPFYFTSFSISDKIKEENREALQNTMIVSSWSDSLRSKKNLSFVEKHKAIFHQAPNIFGLLGYETGMILENLLKDNDSIPSLEQLIDKMEEALEGPRGKIQFHPETNRTSFDNYIFKITDDGIQIETVLKNDGQFIQNIMSDQRPQSMGGWHNAYLCH